MKADPIPSWMPKVGVAFGAVTLVFFILVAAATIGGIELTKTARAVTTIVLALGAGLSTSFLGGTATASGHLKIPFSDISPIAFAVSGGVGVTVILLVLGFTLFAAAPQSDTESLVAIVESTGRKPTDRLRALRQLREELRFTDFRGKNLSGLDLRTLTWSGVDLREAKLSNAILTSADLRRTDLVRADLNGVHCEGADLRGAQLNGAIMNYAKCSGATLSEVWLRAGSYEGTDFSRAKLNRTNLQIANFKNTDFRAADLSRADFSDDSGEPAILTGADLRNAILTGAQLAKTIGLESARLTGAVYNDDTSFPAGFNPQSHGAVHQ